ncbi:MAG: hypothetical protein PHO77_09315 [Bacteroidales bacterium]|nr:hypothetical protein [Bacteroidales bacterium]
MDCLQISFDIILTILGLYLAFGKSYFSEKGKNLATKEDIGFITREIETVKNEIVFSIQRKSDFIKESKEVALAFNDNASFFIDYSSKVIDILANNSNNREIILKQMEDIRLQGAKVVSAFLKIFIYFDDSPFRKSAEDYYDSTVKIQQLAISVLFQLEQLAQKESILLESLKNGQIQYKDKLLELAKSRKEIIEIHINDRTKLLDSEVYKLRGIFIGELSKLMKIEK